MRTTFAGIGRRGAVVVALLASALAASVVSGVTANAAGDTAPVGSLDSCISGWARDPDFAGSIDVHLYVNGVHVASQTANQPSEPAVGGNGAHRFSFPLEALPSSNGGQRVQVFALSRDAAGAAVNNNPSLPLGPAAPKAMDSSGAVTGAYCTRPSDEATFEDYERLLCPAARARGLQTRVLGEREAPLLVNDTFADGTAGQWTHIGEPAPCLSFFVDRLAEPYRSNYKATLKKLHDAFAACKDAGFRTDGKRGYAYNPTYDYRNRNAAGAAGTQGGDRWGQCLSKPPWTQTPTTQQIQEGANYLEPLPGSVIDSLVFCRDERATAWPDHLDCTTPYADSYRATREARVAAGEATTVWLTQAREKRLAMREALGVSVTSSATGSGSGSRVSSDLTPASQPLTFAALTALVG